MPPKNNESRGLLGWTFAAALLVGLTAAPLSAEASTFKVLHSFCKQVECGDGDFPTESLTMDQAGNLYGTASGGAHGQGIVFRLLAPVDGRRWTYENLYHFCAQPNCTDGRDPTASALIVDTAGNVYGTTAGGGLGNDTGTVFELSPPVSGKHWTRRTLYNFCAALSNCHDGAGPGGGLTYAGREQGLPYDGVSSLYGTTTQGGGHFGGVAYSLKPKRNGEWNEAVLYAFCHAKSQPCPDGAAPIQQLTMDASGNLYGTTSSGAANHKGGAFELSGNGKHMTEIELYDFCSACIVESGLTIDTSGNLFGSSWLGGGGTACTDSGGCGFIFEIGADRSVTTLYSFCQLQNCVDGWRPVNRGGLAIDADGSLYGTTTFGGANGFGNLFRLNGTSLQVLHDFCAMPSCVDGFVQFDGPIRSPIGELFGVSGRGGAYQDGGTVFELTP